MYKIFVVLFCQDFVSAPLLCGLNMVLFFLFKDHNRHGKGYSTGQGFFHQSACPRLVIIFASRDPALPSAHSPPATVFFPTAIRRGSTAERSSYLYNHAVGSPGVDDENI